MIQTSHSSSTDGVVDGDWCWVFQCWSNQVEGEFTIHWSTVVVFFAVGCARYRHADRIIINNEQIVELVIYVWIQADIRIAINNVIARVRIAISDSNHNVFNSFSQQIIKRDQVECC